MKLSDFDYVLPKERIAQVPVEPRDASRMMVLRRSDLSIEDKHFYDLPDFLTSNDVLVFNKSKVIPARILFTFQEKECEVFYVREIEKNLWEVMVRPGRLFQKGSHIVIDEHVSLDVEEVLPESEHGHRIVRVTDVLERDRIEILSVYGSIPLPPYIESKDGVDKYQNVYATDPGSVAAPTAGFHFTESLLEKLQIKGVQMEFITLHVGPGTFLPVMTENILEHSMHEEFFSLPEDVAERLVEAKRQGKRIISVGTTATRVLEHCARSGTLIAETGSTKLFCYPGYQWKCIDALITNFHLPKSTLLMLVSALAGREFILKAYEHAVKDEYRFFSFGDGMLILP